jgi:DNA-binding transcriptional LysR family regulator
MEIEFRHLRYFVAVAEERNFTRAAARLHISQPTLGRQISDIESWLQVRLLNRVRGGLELTESGQEFLEHAYSLLNGSDQLLAAMQRRSKHPLQIGYMASSLFGPVGEAIKRFQESFPIHLVEASPGAQLELLRANKLDIAFIGHKREKEPCDLVFHQLHDLELQAVLPSNHALADRASIHLRELADQPFVGLNDKLFPGRQALIQEFCNQVGFTANFAHLADGLVSLLAVIGHGQGVSLIPADAATLPHPHAVFVPIKEKSVAILFRAAVRRGKLRPEIRTLLKFCQARPLGREVKTAPLRSS